MKKPRPPKVKPIELAMLAAILHRDQNPEYAMKQALIWIGFAKHALSAKKP